MATVPSLTKVMTAAQGVAARDQTEYPRITSQTPYTLCHQRKNLFEPNMNQISCVAMATVAILQFLRRISWRPFISIIFLDILIPTFQTGFCFLSKFCLSKLTNFFFSPKIFQNEHIYIQTISEDIANCISAVFNPTEGR